MAHAVVIQVKIDPNSNIEHRHSILSDFVIPEAKALPNCPSTVGGPFMHVRACAVRMSIAVAVILGSSSLVAIEPNGVAGAASNTKPRVAITSTSVVLSERLS